MLLSISTKGGSIAECCVLSERLTLNASRSTLPHILSGTNFDKTPLQQAFPGSDYKRPEGGLATN